MKEIRVLVKQLELDVYKLYFILEILITKNTKKMKSLPPIITTFKTLNMGSIKMRICIGIIGNFLVTQLQLESIDERKEYYYYTLSS